MISEFGRCRWPVPYCAITRPTCLRLVFPGDCRGRRIVRDRAYGTNRWFKHAIGKISVNRVISGVSWSPLARSMRLSSQSGATWFRSATMASTRADRGKEIGLRSGVFWVLWTDDVGRRRL